MQQLVVIEHPVRKQLFGLSDVFVVVETYCQLVKPKEQPVGLVKLADPFDHKVDGAGQVNNVEDEENGVGPPLVLGQDSLGTKLSV